MRVDAKVKAMSSAIAQMPRLYKDMLFYCYFMPDGFRLAVSSLRLCKKCAENILFDAKYHLEEVLGFDFTENELKKSIQFLEDLENKYLAKQYEQDEDYPFI